MAGEHFTLDQVTSGKTSDYVKLFKNKALWKNKTNFAILMTKFKLDKKVIVAIPFKKEIDAKNTFKRIKKDKVHPLNKVAVGSIAYDDKGLKFIFTMTGGAADIATLQTSGIKLFEKMKVSFEVKMGEIDPEMQVAASEIVPDNDTEEEAVLEDTIFDWTEIAKEGEALMAEAQAFAKNPDKDKAAHLRETVATFLADYEDALKDSGDISPTPTLVRNQISLKNLLQKLDSKIGAPKQEAKADLNAMMEEYKAVSKEILAEIMPLMKNPLSIFSAQHNDKVLKALELIQNFKTHYPKADSLLKAKLAEFNKSLDTHEPQLNGIVNKIKNSVGHIVKEAKEKVDAALNKYMNIYNQLSPEAQAQLSLKK